jgi:hypothetical protein
MILFLSLINFGFSFFESDMRVMAFGFWLLAFGFWLLAFGFWLLAFGFWLLAFGTSNRHRHYHQTVIPNPVSSGALSSAPE